MPTPYHTPYQTLGGWMIDGILHVPVVKVKDEREACAKIADAVAADKRGHDFAGIRKGCAEGIAESIRARANT